MNPLKTATANLERLKSELKTYLELQAQLPKSIHIEKWESHGVALFADKGDDKVDLLVTVLVHGDEVGSLEAVNLFLSRLVLGERTLRGSIGFLVCNYEAALRGVRFIDIDLNRSFLAPETGAEESARAREIEQVILRSRCMVDLHQTVEPTESPFFVVVDDPKLVRWAYSLDAQMPIATFPAMGFSHSGKTSIEFAMANNIPGVVIELGALGFSQPMATRVDRFIWAALQKVSSKKNQREDYSGEIDTYHLSQYIPNKNGARLRPGLINFMAVKKGDVIAHDDSGPILAPETGRLFFPKYGELADKSPEICEIGVLKRI